MKRYEADVQKLLSVFQPELMTNPFTHSTDDTLPLMNIATGVVIPSEMTKYLVDVEKLGRKPMKSFIEECLNTKDKNIQDSVPQLKLKTFASLKRKTTVPNNA